MLMRILIIDDDEKMCQSLKIEFERRKMGTVFVAHLERSLSVLLRLERFHLVLVNFQAFSGRARQFVNEARQKDRALGVIGIARERNEVEILGALKSQVKDYFIEPFRMEDIVESVMTRLNEYEQELRNARWISRAKARLKRAEGVLEERFCFSSKSRSMQTVNETLVSLRRDVMRGIAEEPPVLLFGEKGSGAQGVAWAIHLGSQRNRGPWIVLNCAQFSPYEIDHELYGYEQYGSLDRKDLRRGALELAHEGTLFLDRIESLNEEAQSKLLQALKAKSFRRVGSSAEVVFDVRVIAAVQGIQEEFLNGKREDFKNFLGKTLITVPPLRERPEDILPLATQFAERCFRTLGQNFQGFNPDLQNSWSQYSWPGNLVELWNEVERFAWVADSKSSQRLSFQKLEVSFSGNLSQMTASSLSYTENKKRWSEAFERDYLIRTLEKNKGNVSSSAREAKLDRSNFLRLLRRHSLKAQEYRGVQELRKAG